MQENRSFDHYYGTLRGVRGFADKQVLKYQNGTTIFEQPDKARTDLGYLLPFHMDSAKVDAQNAGDLDHSWAGDHSARNSGLWNNWIPAKTEQTMGYFTRNDLPFNYALADAFTICDGYHQSILGPTSPNRMYFWTGTSHGWTYQPAGLHRRVHQRHHLPGAAAEGGHLLAGVHQPRGGRRRAGTTAGSATTATTRCGSTSSTRPRGRRPRRRGSSSPCRARCSPGSRTRARRSARTTSTTCSPSSSPTAPRATIPQVSWIVAPYEYSEHPSASPSYGAHYVRTVLEALMGNQALWETTALFITYDEHDGYFDHVLPPAPETTVTNEFIDGLPIGPARRVPMIICSPWTRGGYVDSNSYDHTSMLRFLETWTGVRAPNITGWRRSVTGDLTAAFDFANPDFSSRRCRTRCR